MAGKLVITTAKNGEFTFNLKASNGEVILTASETYTTMSACENGIASVKKNCGANIEDQIRGETQKHPKYELYKDKAGEFRFRLKAANGEIIAARDKDGRLPVLIGKSEVRCLDSCLEHIISLLDI